MNQCCESVRDGTDGWRTRYKQCAKAGKVERDGKWYCGIHDLVAKAERDKARYEQWKVQQRARDADSRLRSAAPALLAALKAFVADWDGFIEASPETQEQAA